MLTSHDYDVANIVGDIEAMELPKAQEFKTEVGSWIARNLRPSCHDIRGEGGLPGPAVGQVTGPCDFERRKTSSGVAPISALYICML